MVVRDLDDASELRVVDVRGGVDLPEALLGSARAGAGVAAFLIGGMLGTFIGWRPVFGFWW